MKDFKSIVQEAMDIGVRLKLDVNPLMGVDDSNELYELVEKVNICVHEEESKAHLSFEFKLPDFYTFFTDFELQEAEEFYKTFTAAINLARCVEKEIKKTPLEITFNVGEL